MHINNIRSYTNIDPPKKGARPLRHLTDNYHLKFLKQECIGCLKDQHIYIN